MSLLIHEEDHNKLHEKAVFLAVQNVLSCLNNNMKKHHIIKFYIQHQFIFNLPYKQITSMTSLQPYEINHVDFSSRFKSIRKEKDCHLGQYQLMKDKETKKRVVVKNQPFENQQELQYILQGIESLIILNECPSLVKFIGYSIKGKIMSLIYENHENTLEESLKGINNRNMSDKSIINFLTNMIEALAFLQSLKLNYLDLKTSSILEQNKESLNNCYKLFYTHYTTDAVSQIRQLQVPIQNYFLSSLQLDQLNSEEIELTFQDKIHSDIQSLGLIGLWLGTPNVKDKFYQYNEDDELQINQQAVARRMKEFRKNYSKKTVKILEMLLGGQEDTFHDILNTLGQSSIQKTKKHVTITQYDDEQPRDNSIQKFQHHRSNMQFKSEQSSVNIQQSARRKNYLNNLRLIQQRLIYRSGTKQLLPNMQQKQYADGSYYIGQLSAANNRQGQGIYYYSEGDVYAGDWKDNTLQGYGIYLFSNGEKYEGDVEKGVKVGKGQYIYCNNNRYDGEWLNDKKHGFGKYYYENKGERYEGQFKNGSKEGNGIFYYLNGDKYQGTFHHGDKHGSGSAKYQNGTKVTGSWQNGQLNGNGYVEYRNGDKSTAEFVKGVKDGHGNYIYQNSTEFQGQYQNNNKSGSCIIKYSNGDKYKGELLKGKRQGEGAYYYSNGTIYNGEWKDNHRHGRGQFKLPNGLVVSGSWNMSNLLNPCTISYSNGDIYEGNTTKIIVKEGQGSYNFSTGEKLQGQFKNGNFVKGLYIDSSGNQSFI